MSTKCSNTPVCWSCSAPVFIEFVHGTDVSGFTHAPGLIYGNNVLQIKRGRIQQGYKTDYISVLPASGTPFPINHRDIVKVTDAYHSTIWENSAC